MGGGHSHGSSTQAGERDTLSWLLYIQSPIQCGWASGIAGERFLRPGKEAQTQGKAVTLAKCTHTSS